MDPDPDRPAGPPQRDSAAALAEIRRRTEDILAGRVEPYDGGLQIMGAAMSDVTDTDTDGEHCHAIYLIWGALTDWVELKPDESSQAEEAMRRAAREWLEARSDEAAWRAYADRWLYTELDYERP